MKKRTPPSTDHGAEKTAARSGPGRPPKSDYKVFMDHARARYLQMALETFTPIFKKHGVKNPRAVLIATIAGVFSKSPKTIQDWIGQEHRRRRRNAR